MKRWIPNSSRRRQILLARGLRVLIVLLGILLGQAVLYGPSLIGLRYLLPLKLLAGPSYYLPRDAHVDDVPDNLVELDLVTYQEPERLFAYHEFAAGRFPLWTPHRFAGAPLYPLSYSPLWLPAYFIRSPVVLAWVQVAVALTAGLGMFTFCRRVLRVGFWPAAIVAWCYPLTGAYIVWEGWWLPAVMCWLPWMLTAVHSAVRRPAGWGPPAIALISAIILVSGASDVAGQVLLTSGLFACWSLLHRFGLRRWPLRKFAAIAALSLAWALGIAGSAWIMLPFQQYVHTGSRMQARSAGREERPPVGLSELPQVVLPHMYGASQKNNVRIAADEIPESSVAAYVGLWAALVAAPLALASRRHRSINIFLLLLTFISLAWTLNVPGIVQVLRLPVLNMMSHNRLVFVASLAMLAMAAVGLEQIFKGALRPRWWFELPVILLVLLAGWCFFRAVNLPAEIAQGLGDAISRGTFIFTVRTQDGVAAAQQWFREKYIVAGSVALLGLAGWYCIRAGRRVPRFLQVCIPALMLGELLYFGFGVSSQSDPALYFPKVDLLEQIKAGAPGRIMGFDCLPPNFSQAVGLDDIRGYDGVDPSRIVELINAASLPQKSPPPYARTQFSAPILVLDNTGTVHFRPILSMLGVRYVIFRNIIPSRITPDLKSQDYWALINKEVAPRVFVPEKVECLPDSAERLKRLASPDFAPLKLAFVEQDLSLPPGAKGSGVITRDNPQDILISATMDSPGLLILADNWDPGWQAYVDGIKTTVFRADHALRGVIVPSGSHTVEYRFEPAAMRIGLWISGAAAAALAAWSLLILTRRRAYAPSARLIRYPRRALRQQQPQLIRQ